MGGTAPALARYTNGVLFGDLWRRPDLAPRDRSLVTIAALIAAGQVDQLAFHIDRGMNNGLTRTEVSEIITHLAFYAGWPRAVSAVPVAKKVFEARAGAPAQASDRARGARCWKSCVRVRSRPTKGSPDYFIGSVSVDQRFQRTDPARVGGGIVTFEPGARTAWHTHPLGQTLIVTSGTGWVQREGGPVEEIRPGDVVWIPPGVRHWHGATRDHGDEPRRHRRSARRQERRLDGAGLRGTVPARAALIASSAARIGARHAKFPRPRRLAGAICWSAPPPRQRW